MLQGAVAKVPLPEQARSAVVSGQPTNFLQHFQQAQGPILGNGMTGEICTFFFNMGFSGPHGAKNGRLIILIFHGTSL